MRRACLLTALAIAAGGPSLEAQAGQRARPEDRAELEAEVRRGFTRAVRQQVELSDDQMQRLSAVTQRYAVERRRLQMEERATRMGLQRMLRDPATADSAAVETALQRLLDVQKRRVQLVELEQRDLAAFMSPVQRARFMALQEQLRRRLEQRRMGGGREQEPRRGPPR